MGNIKLVEPGMPASKWRLEGRGPSHVVHFAAFAGDSRADELRHLAQRPDWSLAAVIGTPAAEYDNRLRQHGDEAVPAVAFAAAGLLFYRTLPEVPPVATVGGQRLRVAGLRFGSGMLQGVLGFCVGHESVFMSYDTQHAIGVAAIDSGTLCVDCDEPEDVATPVF
jgi:hypothetical protein